MNTKSSAIQAESKAVPFKTVVITCSVLEDEIGHYRQGMEHILHVELMEQGLHNEPKNLRRQLQEKITEIEGRFSEVEAIVLGYGLCSKGTEELVAKHCKIVIARAHDCITLLLGSKERYAEYLAKHPGSYWYSPGWNRHHTPPGKERYEKLHREYVEKYGQDNAEFLMESEQHWFSTYDRATYVELQAGVTKEDIQYTKDCAKWLNWKFDHQKGDPALLLDLLAGNWDEERFLVIEPGKTIRFSGDHRVVKSADPDPLE